MANKLKKLRIGEVSLVDKGANPGADVVLMKRDYTDDQRKDMAAKGEAMPDGGFPIANEADLHNAVQAFGRAKDPVAAKKHIVTRAKSMGKESVLPGDWVQKSETDVEAFAGTVTKMLTALQESFASIVEGSTADKAALDTSFGQFSEAVLASLPEDVKKAAAALAVTKAGASGNNEDGTMTFTKEQLDAEIAKAVAAASTKAVLEFAKARMSKDENDFMDTMKGDDDKKAFAALTAEERAKKMGVKKREELPDDIKKQLADGEELKKRLQVLEDDKVNTAFVKRASGLGVPNGTELAPALIALSKAEGGEALLAVVEKTLKGLTDQVKTGKLFSEFGKSGDAPAGTGAYDLIKAEADSIKKADTSLTDAQAFDKAMQLRPDLTKMYREERAKATGVAA